MVVWTCPTLQVCEVALLVEASLVKTERVDNIDLLLDLVVGTIFLLLGGGVGTSVCRLLDMCTTRTGCRGHTEALASNGDLLAVGLVDDAVNLLEVIRVGDDLVAGEQVLKTTS